MKRQNLQSRLYGVFTILFAFSVVVLAFFLYNAVRMIGVHNTAQSAFDLNRQIYRLLNTTQQFEQALNYYEANGSERYLEKAIALGSRMEDMVENLRPQLDDADDIAALDAYMTARVELVPVVEQIEQAVDAEDWEQVGLLDDQVYEIVPGMYDNLFAITTRSDEALEDVNSQVDTFNFMATLSSIMGLPIFLVLAVVAALLIYGQINHPLQALTQAVKGLLSGGYPQDEVQKLAARGDEIGFMASEFTIMAAGVEQRTGQLQQEAGALRAKIR